jgi:hypothetical protein
MKQRRGIGEVDPAKPLGSRLKYYTRCVFLGDKKAYEN